MATLAAAGVDAKPPPATAGDGAAGGDGGGSKAASTAPPRRRRRAGDGRLQRARPLHVAALLVVATPQVSELDVPLVLAPASFWGARRRAVFGDKSPRGRRPRPIRL